MVRVTHNGQVIVSQLEKMEARVRDARPVLRDFGEHMVESSIPKTFAAGGRPNKWPGSKWQMGDRPQHDTGRLQRSIESEPGTDRVRIGTNYLPARIRHLGGDIVAKPGKALVIPLPGLPRNRRRPKHWPGLFRLPSNKPNTVGVLATSDSAGNVTPRFVLRRKVTQPARPFLVIQDEDVAYLQGTLTRWARDGEL